MSAAESATRGSAMISRCGTYRYSLQRTWDEERPPLVVIGVNPSTADASLDDPTIRRCVTYARDWSYGRLVMLNLFAFRSTDPLALKQAAARNVDVVGPDNDRTLLEQTKDRDVLVAWGAHGRFANRDLAVIRMLRPAETRKTDRPLLCLGYNNDLSPKHPLYLKRSLRPWAFTQQGGPDLPLPACAACKDLLLKTATGWTCERGCE